MATAALRLGPHARLRLGTRSARLRLTLLYSGMFLALGTAVIVIIFLVGWSGAAISVQSVAVAHPTAVGAPDIHTAVSQQRSADLSRLLGGAWLTLAVTAVISAVLGWFLAGRMLRPLREMTATARTISVGNLHERLALSGPDDEFKALGDTIDDLLARLEASFAAQRRFVANAAHELRTPLTVERTLLQVALADEDAGAEGLRATCEELLVTGREHERLLDSLLTLATSERGLQHRVPLDLAEVAAMLLTASQPRIVEAQLELSAHLEPAATSGDRALIERLLANLIDNAIDYNHAGGRIEIWTAAERERATLGIANTGPRISAEEVERLFDPFRRQRGDRSGPADGHHGLGLSIVRAVVEAHDASLSAAPGPDGGLAINVAFDLPVSRELTKDLASESAS